MTPKSVIIYSDGACSGNPGPGGWGSIVCVNHSHVVELGGGDRVTTNNRMEIEGALRALELAAKEDLNSVVVVYTDSTYLIRGITQWVWGWKRKGWTTAEGQPVNNRDLWEQLLGVVGRIGRDRLEWSYVRGHRGIPGNERCDEIAVAYSQGRSVRLYSGPVAGYGVDVITPPPAEPLPEMKPKAGPSAKPLCYLSNVGGVVYRHADWASCERRVKGQSGAKFKKVMNAEEESELLRSWGVDPAKVQS